MPLCPAKCQPKIYLPHITLQLPEQATWNIVPRAATRPWCLNFPFSWTPLLMRIYLLLCFTNPKFRLAFLSLLWITFLRQTIFPNCCRSAVRCKTTRMWQQQWYELVDSWERVVTCGWEYGHLVDCVLIRLCTYALGNCVPRSIQFSVWTVRNILKFMTLGSSY
jgi:hypothetical protein